MILRPGLRKLALTAHVGFSVGWLGAVAAFLGLAIAGVSSTDIRTVRAAYLGADLVTRFVVVPLSLGALVTGLVQAFGTTWGLFRHYWVLVKFALTVVAIAVLLQYTQTVMFMAELAGRPVLSAGDLAVLRSPTFLIHGGGALVILLATTALSAYKPPGMTRRGHRAA